jgi:hypothetical protein
MKIQMVFRRLCLLPLCLLIVFFFGCGSEETKYVGNYKAIKGGTPAKSESQLVLKEKGEGIWRTEDDEVSFSCHPKGGELRFLTKNGGVIVGEIHKDTISVTLPGDRSITFKKIQ